MTFLAGAGLVWFLAAGWSLPLYESETLAEWYPYRNFFNRTISQGIFPAWCPDLLCGFPFIGWAHSSGLAPAGVLYYFLPFERAAVISLFFHGWLVMIGLYYLQRSLRVGPGAAFLCAAAVGFGFFIPAEQRHFLPRLFSLSWTPLMWAFLVKMLSQRKLRHFLLFILTAWLCCIGGQAEIFARSMSLALFILLLFLFVFRPPRRDLVPMAILYLGALALIFFAAAPQLLSTLELVEASTRQTKYFFPHYALTSGWRAGTIFFPFMEVNVFLVWGLAASLPTLRRDRVNAILVFTIGVCLALAFNFLGILHVTHLIPVFNRLLWHIYMLPLAAFLGAVLAGRVIDGMLQAGASFHASRVFPWFAAAYFLAIAAYIQVIGQDSDNTGLFKGVAYLSSLALLLVGWRSVRLPDWRRMALAVSLAAMIVLALLMITHDEHFKFQFSRKYQAAVSGNYGSCRTLNISNHSYFRRLSIPYQAGILDRTQSMDFFIQVIPMWSYEYFFLIRPFWTDESWLHFTTQVFDTFKHGNFLDNRNSRLFNFLNTCIIAADHENLKFAPDYQIAYFITPRECAPGACTILDAGESPWQKPAIGMLPGSRLKHTVYLPRGSRLEFGIAVDRAHASAAVEFGVMIAKPGSDSFRPVFTQSLDAGEQTHNIDLNDYSGQTIDLVFAVNAGGHLEHGWFIAPSIIHDQSPFKKILQDNDLRIYRNSEALPRAFLVHESTIVPGKQARLEFLKSPAFDPARTVVLEVAPSPIPNAGAHSRPEFVRIDEYAEGELRLSARLVAPGILVMSETWFPGWIATVDGVEKPILRANHAFRGIALEPGFHDVHMVYHPVPLRVGLFASIACLLLISVMIVIRLAGRKTKAGDIRGRGAEGVIVAGAE